METIAPEMLQTGVVAEVKLTGRPELAVAPTGNAGSPKVWSGGPMKLIVWACSGRGPMVKLCVTGAAALNPEFPDWLAVMEHVPALSSDTVAPANAQTEGVADTKLTGSPEVAIALMENAASPKV